MTVGASCIPQLGSAPLPLDSAPLLLKHLFSSGGICKPCCNCFLGLHTWPWFSASSFPFLVFPRFPSCDPGTFWTRASQVRLPPHWSDTVVLDEWGLLEVSWHLSPRFGDSDQFLLCCCITLFWPLGGHLEEVICILPVVHFPTVLQPGNASKQS